MGSWAERADMQNIKLREILEEGGVIIQKIRTTENPADMMTKVIIAVKFKHCLDLINIVKIWKMNLQTLLKVEFMRKLYEIFTKVEICWFLQK